MSRRFLLVCRRVVVFVALAVFAQGLGEAASSLPSLGGPTVPESLAVPNSWSGLAGSLSAPAPSGAVGAYPVNHGLAGEVAVVGGVANSDFESAPVVVGEVANHDFEDPAVVLDAPLNNDFETGDLSDWVTAGTPAAGAGESGGFAAHLDSSGDSVTSSVVSVPASGGLLSFGAGYLSTSGYSWIRVYVEHGPGFATSTQLESLLCSGCGSWRAELLDLSGYAGEDVKLRFKRSMGVVAVDDVEVVGVPGWELSGTASVEAEAGPNRFVRLGGSGRATSEPIVVPTDAEQGSVRVRDFGSNGQFYVTVLHGTDFSESTNAIIGTSAPAAWETQSFDVSEWLGETIKIQVRRGYGTVEFDDVGVFEDRVADWSATGSVEFGDNGSGGTTLVMDGSITSEPVELAAEADQLVVSARSDTGTTDYSIEVLSGTTFDEATALDTIAGTDTVFSENRFGVGAWIGETVKVRISKNYGGGDLEIDTAGTVESVALGWSVFDGGLGAGTDAHGDYVDTEPGEWVEFHSTIVERSWSGAYEISYDIGDTDPNQTSSLIVYWEDEAGTRSQIFYEVAATETGYTTDSAVVHDSLGDSGRFVVKARGPARIYAIGDNIARQHVADPHSAQVGLGVDTTTGGFSFSETDLSIAGSMPWALSRYHNTESGATGTLGTGWSHTFDTRLEVYRPYFWTDVAVVFGSGREEAFDGNALGLTSYDPRVTSTLLRNPDESFTYETLDKSVYEFTATGELTEISDPDGNTISVSRDGAGRVVTVSDDAARSVTFQYDLDGYLASVTGPNGGVTTYGYVNGELVSVTDAEGSTRSYEYDSGRLVEVIDGDSNTVVSNVVDGFGRVITQTDSVGSSITLDHETPGVGATSVTNPEGGQAVYYFDAHQRTTHAVDPDGNVNAYLFDNTTGDLTAIVDPASNQWDFAYDSSHQMLSSTDPLGNPINIAYNPDHLPTSVTDANNNTTTITYDSTGNPTSTTDPAGNTTTVVYDSAGNPTSTTDPLGNTTTRTFDSAGNVLTQTDPTGHTTTWTYNTLGLVTSETDPLGNTQQYKRDLLGRVYETIDPEANSTQYFWGSSNQLIAKWDPAGNQTLWAYDTRGLVISRTDPAGVTTYSYDDDRNLTSITDNASNTTSYIYDDAGRVIEAVEPDGTSTLYGYDLNGELAAVTDAVGGVTTYTYTDTGLLETITDPGSATTNYSYDPVGNMTAITDPLGNTTTYSYDNRNLLASVTNPAGEQTQYGYDNAANRTSITDNASNTTVFTVDPNRRITAVTDPAGNIEASVFDPAGRRTASIDALGNTTTYSYDANDRVASISRPGGGTTAFVYDQLGRTVSSTDPLGAITTNSYDTAGRLATVTDDAGNVTSHSYDAAGNLASVTDPENNTTSWTYDSMGRREIETDPLGGTVEYEYDDIGRLVALTDPNDNTRSFGFDIQSNLTSTTDPLGRATSHTYDLSGRRTSSTDPRGVTTTYDYDDAGRLTTTSYPGGTTTLGYDTVGRRASMTDPTGTTTWSYDNTGQLTQVTAPGGTLNYGYDAAGNQTSLGRPEGTVTTSYDADRNIASVIDWANQTTNFTYDVAGRQTGIERPNNVDTTNTYDTLGQITNIEHSGPAGTLETFAYTYDKTGNRTSVTSTAGTENYTIDELNRLTQVTYPDATSTAYTYDPAGNRLTETTGTQTTNYSYDAAGQLTNIDGQSLSYDPNGNLTNDGTTTYTWDWNNRLTTTSQGTNTTNYSYDGENLLTGINSQDLLWDRQHANPQLVTDATTSYHNAAGAVSETDPTGTSYLLTDALGSTRASTGTTGTITGTATYSPFGETLTDTTGANLGYTGEYSTDAGVYLRARHYQPETGRFLGADTVQPNADGTQGWNQYAYTNNNPTTWTDPSGHYAQPALDAARLIVLHRLLLANPISTTAVGSAALPVVPTFGFMVLIVVAFALVGLVLYCATTPGCIPDLQELIGIDRTNSGPTQTTNQDTDPNPEPENPIPPIPLPPPPGPCDAPQTGADCDGDAWVIGESSRRTREAAAAFGARYWPGLEGQHIPHEDLCRENEAWLRAVIAKGDHIIDIGIDTSRVGSRSPYYQLEQRIVAEVHVVVERRYWEPSYGEYEPVPQGPCP